MNLKYLQVSVIVLNVGNSLAMQQDAPKILEESKPQIVVQSKEDFVVKTRSEFETKYPEVVSKLKIDQKFLSDNKSALQYIKKNQHAGAFLTTLINNYNTIEYPYAFTLIAQNELTDYSLQDLAKLGLKVFLKEEVDEEQLKKACWNTIDYLGRQRRGDGPVIAKKKTCGCFGN